ncbi:hypothetical protein [Candidatus Villigracilis affinis]|uniref:hypothetical protein n=1 Tax=Candidatus Villigracilis affinis TaxID=3140682 RepID=UPI001DE3744C|nr:hypothetical protein [Anaerolineales bacterium]
MDRFSESFEDRIDIFAPIWRFPNPFRGKRNLSQNSFALMAGCLPQICPATLCSNTPLKDIPSVCTKDIVATMINAAEKKSQK